MPPLFAVWRTLISTLGSDRRLSQQTRLLKERNQSLLRAVGTARSTSGGASTSSGGGAEYAACLSSSSQLTYTQDSTAVQTAYIASLESQMSSLRDEMAAVYKTQGQNAQRLLSMNETLREKEELARIEAEALRKARDEVAILRRKVEQHDEIMLEKDRSVQVSLQVSPCFSVCPPWSFLDITWRNSISQPRTQPSNRPKWSP